jgi:hypothetical protein
MIRLIGRWSLILFLLKNFHARPSFSIHKNLLEKSSGSVAWFSNVNTVQNITGELTFRFFLIYTNVWTRMRLSLSLFPPIFLSRLSVMLFLFFPIANFDSLGMGCFGSAVRPTSSDFVPSSTNFLTLLVRSALLGFSEAP